MNNLSNIYPERNYADARKMMPYLGKTFYEINKQNSNEYRTITFHLNVFNSRVTPMYSNFITGIPSDNMEPIQPRFLSAMMRYNSIQDAPFH